MAWAAKDLGSYQALGRRKSAKDFRMEFTMDNYSSIYYQDDTLARDPSTSHLVSFDDSIPEMRQWRQPADLKGCRRQSHALDVPRWGTWHWKPKVVRLSIFTLSKAGENKFEHLD